MRFRLAWGSAGTLFRLLLSNYTVLVQEFIAARCNNYCSALTNLGFSFTLTDQCTFSLWMFTIAGSDAYAWCNNLLQRAAIMLMQRPGTFLTLALDLLINSPFSSQCMKNYQWMCNLGCLGSLWGFEFWPEQIVITHCNYQLKCHAAIIYCSADAIAGLLTGLVSG